MAAAIILIPEMLSGPDRDSAEPQEQTTGEGGNEAGIKTYTIDLSQSPGAQPPMPVETTDNRAPPPEVVASEAAPPPEQPQPQVVPEARPVTPAEGPEQRTPAPAATVAETPRPEPRAETPRVTAPKPEPQKAEPRAVASSQTAPRSSAPAASSPTTGKGWAVQLGSYSSEATATRLMNEWRGKGQSAFVMPVSTGGKTLYRVRIGPSKDRAGAEAVLKTVKASIPGAAVVAHP